MFLLIPITTLICLSILSTFSICKAQGGEPPQKTPCTKPLIRKEWRTLSHSDQETYLKAIQCLLTKPGLTPPTIAPGAKTRYDDLVATHVSQTFSIHYVGHFLPWHRYFTAVYEEALRVECGYEGVEGGGGLPYWDWTLDTGSAEDMMNSPVFDPVYGFGGNGAYVVATNTSDPNQVPGRTGGGCILNGPFKNMTVRLGPGADLSGNNPRCLARDFSPYFFSRYCAWNQTKLTLDQEDYGWFSRVVEGRPGWDVSGIHGGGHFGVGGTYGEMGDLYASPSDPIFYMHHANLDRVWWSWQARNLSTRLLDMSGPIYLMDYENAQGGNVTLDFEMSVGVNAPNVTVGDVMDIQGETLCYEYDSLHEID